MIVIWVIRFATLFLVIGVAVIIGGMAQANSTYFEEYAVECTFADDKVGKLNIRRSDGAFGPEPVALYLSDDRGLMIGLLPVYHKIFLVEQGTAGCGAIDPHNLLFYQPDASEIPESEGRKDDSATPTPLEATRESGQKSFGFSQRALGVGEVLRASAQVLSQRKAEAAGFAAIALIGIAILFGLIKTFRSKNNVWVIVAITAASAAGLAVAGFVALVLMNLGGLGWLQIGIPVVLGVVLFAMLRMGWGRFSRTDKETG